MKMGEIWFPRKTAYLINEPSLVNYVLVKEWRKFPKHEMLWRQLRSLLGDSIFTTNGEVWEKQRRMIDPAFANARMKVVLPLMQMAVEDMLVRFEELSGQNKPVDVEIEMTHITADIIFRTILSQPIGPEEAEVVFSAFSKYQEKALRAALLKVFRLPAFFYDRQADACAIKIRTLLSGMIRSRYDAYHSGQAGEESDILSSLLAEMDPDSGEHFSYEELLDHICMLFLAGHETSASALTWALYLIGSVPDVQQRMYEEIRSVLGDRQVEFGDLKKLRLTWNVFRETLRLYPPVGYFVREASETQVMRDKTVKKGCPVGISPWLIQRHRHMWDRPDVFDPDRWDREESKQSQKDAYLPFGAGPRVCIGAAFATQEAILILANLVRSFEFSAIEGDVPEPVGRVTIRSAHGVRLKVTKR